ncbi:methionyl-tRNA formyltransferase [Kosmotoga arenicorallina S304]|uniref:Methionyl-tRNA formyltransferase n=1 Tax=Kosmotoga arenicorallina S304 TaxID=1453497 RepID=A0A176K1G5_9BACT|nr:methionyl-tRNA formyltransferase [Kosmotoga arenicorallina]OAA30992.1 methionyl-tRNA formyltransferase [Kosmotoga arenicorallina S304]
MRIVFMGTPEFAAMHLKTLLEDSWNIVGVFSQPDKEKGRGRKLEPTPVKLVAREFGIPVFQPKSVNKGEGFEALSSLSPDVIITVAYGKLLKKNVITLPPLGCYNVHASLLPKYRGAAPIQRALEAGESKTGITIFQIDEGMDSGPIAMVREVEIFPEDNLGTLSEKLCQLGCHMLTEFMVNLYRGKIALVPQNHELATYAPKITKEDTIITDFDDACRIYNKIRAYDPEPGVRVKLGEKMIKLYDALFQNETPDGIPGEIISIGKKYMIVKCQKGVLKISGIQFPGKKKISPWQAKAGRLITEGQVLGGK